MVDWLYCHIPIRRLTCNIHPLLHLPKRVQIQGIRPQPKSTSRPRDWNFSFNHRLLIKIQDYWAWTSRNSSDISLTRDLQKLCLCLQCLLYCSRMQRKCSSLGFRDEVLEYCEENAVDWIEPEPWEIQLQILVDILVWVYVKRRFWHTLRRFYPS